MIWLLIAAAIVVAFVVLVAFGLCRSAAEADREIREALRESACAHQREDGRW